MITQGTWERVVNHLPAADYARNLILCNGKQVANAMSSTIKKADQESNAALIAAAPDLLALAKDILEWDGILDHSKVRIADAIAKAEPTK